MRNQKIDLLRFIGLAMIILAHVGPPLWLFQLRNFDVPLMVLVSGLSFGLADKPEPYRAYVWKRIKRLLFPVWLFLSAYFLLLALTAYPMPLPDKKTIATSYLLLSGIGYVWIIRVLLMVALIAPLIRKIDRSVRSHAQYFLLLAASYAGYELLVFASKPYLQTLAGNLFDKSVLYLLPYAIVFAFGLRLAQLTRAQVGLLTALLWLAFFSAEAWFAARTGALVATQDFKYPPQLIYLAYALGVAGILWLLAQPLFGLIKQCRLAPPLLFIAQNSIWVYLWHIPLIEMVWLPFYWKYPLVFGGAALIAWIQIQLVKKFLLPAIARPALRRDLNLVLTG